MQYIPLTVHLNAMAQLYQQCASLSEKCDNQNKNDEYVDLEPKKIILENFQQYKAQLIEEPQKEQQVEQKSESSKQNDFSANNFKEKEFVELEIVGSESISKATKKIKKTDKLEFVSCGYCGKKLKNKNSLKKHEQRLHQSKPAKSHTKKATNKQDIMVQI